MLYNRSRCEKTASNGFLDNSRRNIEKIAWGVALNFLTQFEEDGNALLEQIITDDESWIHFYEPERKSVSIVRERKGGSNEKIQEWVVH